MTDPRLSSAAERRDLGAVVEAVGEATEMPLGPLASCARALVAWKLADAEKAPAIVLMVLEEVLRQARACTVCGEIHQPRKVPVRGGTPLMTWDALDGHHYQESSGRGAAWLDGILQEGA